MQFELMASMMCADYGNLEKEVQKLEEGGIDSFHIDIMDGRYVPNYAMSLNDMKYIASAASRPLDVHLMIEHPNNNIDLFLRNLHAGDTVYIHPEAEYHPSTTLQAIIDAGIIPGIAINPGTSVESVMEMLRIVKKVLVMSVNPGLTEEKAREMLKRLDRKHGKYFKFYTGLEWGKAMNYDLCVNSASYGIQGSVDMILRMFKEE